MKLRRLSREQARNKIVLTGDCEQIDSPYLDSINNGLPIVSKDSWVDIIGHDVKGWREVSAIGIASQNDPIKTEKKTFKSTFVHQLFV